jgi:hypothetical protein
MDGRSRGDGERLRLTTANTEAGMEEPIATYEEARWELKRRFELFPDRVRVTGQGLRFGRFDETVSLSILRPIPNRQWVRGRPFRIGLGFLISAIIWAGLLAASWGRGALSQVEVLLVGLLGSVGLVMMGATARPIEFARFPTDAGPVALDIGRVGPGVQEFDEFVELVISRIQHCKAPSPPQRLL